MPRFACVARIFRGLGVFPPEGLEPSQNRVGGSPPLVPGQLVKRTGNKSWPLVFYDF